MTAGELLPHEVISDRGRRDAAGNATSLAACYWLLLPIQLKDRRGRRAGCTFLGESAKARQFCAVEEGTMEEFVHRDSLTFLPYSEAEATRTPSSIVACMSKQARLDRNGGGGFSYSVIPGSH